jgi:hypothetical protein
VDLRKDEEIILRPAGSRARPVIKELPATSQNPYGVKKSKELNGDQSWSVPVRSTRDPS